MAYTSWRGVVGLIKPTRRPGSLEELIRMLPEGVGIIPLLNDVREGTRAEFKRAIPAYEAKARELVEQGVDVIIPSGTPPFMLLGYEGEARLIEGWEKKYKTQFFTSGMAHVRAMRALGIKKWVGASYSSIQNKIVVKYMGEAGFKVLAMEPIEVPFDQVQNISALELYGHLKKIFLRHRDADGLYIQGGGWRTLDIIDMLEQDCGIPVVHAGCAQAWQIQQRLTICQPRQGFGRLLAELP
jgi:maleate isomerase